MKKTALILCLVLFQTAAFAKHLYLEKDYQRVWCSAQKGVLEYKNSDSSRIDCLTNEFAVEFDFANKWAESIGQALYYSIVTGKRPGIVLISENGDKDTPFINRAVIVAQKFNIRLWLVDTSYLE